jgi:hypothetical protein
MSFSSAVRLSNIKSATRIEAVCKLVTTSLAEEIVNRTPVDTGALKANWDFGRTTAPTNTYLGVHDATDETSMLRVLAAIGKAPVAGTSVYLANNLDYAMDIEYGWSSRKAPEGMVRVTARGFASHVEYAAGAVR